MFRTLICVSALAFAATASAQSAYLTPVSNHGGVLPNGYDFIDMSLFNGNWTPTVTLPSHPRNGARVDIRSYAGYGVTLDTSKTDLGTVAMTLAYGKDYSLVFSTATGKWTFTGNGVRNLTTNNIGAKIPVAPQPISYYAMWDANWAPRVTLPPQAADDDLMVIRSDASYPASVDPSGLLFASTHNVRTGDSYTFAYKQAHKAWLLESAPVRTLYARDVINGVPTPTSPRTRVEFWDTNWTQNVRLPAVAGDRDRITVKSWATYSAVIDPSNINFTGTMLLNTDDEYEFMYNGVTRRWELLSSPKTFYQARQLPTGQMPNMVRPTAAVNFADANWIAKLTLPAVRKPGDRVVVTTSATYGFTVVSDSLSVPVTTGETVAFAVDASGRWQRETKTVDVLLIYSEQAAARLGESAVRARLYEAFTLSNEALESSGANFRYRMVAMQKLATPASWVNLGGPLAGLRDNATAQGWLKQYRADGIYYEGAEDGCGLAWIGGGNGYNMVATGSINCGTTVMRHEMGHNMGLPDAPPNAYVGTVMNGNAMPYFAVRTLFDRKYGIPLSASNDWNEVATMNAQAAIAAAYR